ncbi:hypothetical protein BCR36DRAFT_79905 [Piromyces finnis]|uniref:Telomerase reverse transcriptase n=1 Tax=Piromyces finnis TaxID=1754191 RepID=A0A1Y1V711_9FUNG|nr:hypothetical protein BCR36DRAFT_79905 [Piromyces finnis]|eukprot:ORX48374.1 hypothetical protein BCR36DRAFT_79905 [Piromyces finnis]
MENKPKKKFVSRVHTNEIFPQILKFVKKESLTHKNALFVDQVTHKYIKREDLINILKWHITQSIIKMNHTYYKQVNGIPQGSVISTLVCSIFYSHLENEILTFVKEDKEGLLMHYVDDFLYISTKKENVTKFIHTMKYDKRSYNDYGLLINIKKSLINFEIEYLEQDLKDIPVINSEDKSKYNEESIKNSIVTECLHNSGDTFLKRLLLYIKGRFQPIFFDTKLNSQNCIKRIIKYGCILIKYKTKKRFKNDQLNYECIINKNTIKWLGYKAFYDVITKKPTNFINTIKYLKSEISDRQYTKIIQYIKHYIQCSNDDDVIHILNY